jgi:hypothetical protein
MKTISLEQLAKHENKYVALSKERSVIVASGKSIKEVATVLQERNITDVIIKYIAPIKKLLSPSCL